MVGKIAVASHDSDVPLYSDTPLAVAGGPDWAAHPVPYSVVEEPTRPANIYAMNDRSAIDSAIASGAHVLGNLLIAEVLVVDIASNIDACWDVEGPVTAEEFDFSIFGWCWWIEKLSAYDGQKTPQALHPDAVYAAYSSTCPDERFQVIETVMALLKLSPKEVSASINRDRAYIERAGWRRFEMLNTYEKPEPEGETPHV